MDKIRLIKLMMMTTSNNDAEALVAIRKANADIRAAGSSWNEIISGFKVISKPAKPPPSRPSGRGTSEAAARFNRPTSRFTDPDIPNMLKALLRDSKGSFRDTIESFKEQWDEKGYLSERQYEVVINAFERLK